MKLQEALDNLEPGQILITLLNGKPLRVVVDADTDLGYVDVPDLANSGLTDTPEKGFKLGIIDKLATKRLTGQVEFKKVTKRTGK